MFAIPWHDKTLIGTTDTPLDGMAGTKSPEEEIQFILDTSVYINEDPYTKRYTSVFAGLRLLAAPEKVKTKEISRSHKLILSASGLITITGGKWTTYRKMADSKLAINQVD